MEYDLKNLKLLARGGEADIYDIGDGTILRVMRRQGAKTFETEKKLQPVLIDHKISVPTIFEYLEIDGQPAEVMQKISGESMLEYFKKHPLKIFKLVKQFAGMHVQILDIDSDCGLNCITNTADYFTSNFPLAEKNLMDFALKILEELPVGQNLCHGDFHPGNILMQGEKCYIIDWCGAYYSSFLSDVAHTYLLMSHAPKIPGQSNIQHKVTGFIGSVIAKTYLKEIFKLKKINISEFSKWTVVLTLLRVYNGLPSERSDRINYLQKCYNMHEKNIDASLWYKYL